MFQVSRVNSFNPSKNVTSDKIASGYVHNVSKIIGKSNG